MRFTEIEKVLGFELPNSKRYPAWWSNNPSNNPMTKVWLEAGFMTENVDIPSERLVFRRTKPTPPQGSTPSGSRSASGGVLSRLQSVLRGTVRFAPGFDPTAPTGDVWDSEHE
jgi:hypothetical protein